MSFVVVGVDGSASSRAALSWGVQAALLRGLPVRVVHVPPTGEPGPTETEPTGPALLEACRHEASQAQVAVQTVLGTGDPTRVLLDQARTAALVVVGAIGRTGPRRLRLGSVADQLIQHLDCPVVVTRPTPERGPGSRIVVGVDPAGGTTRAIRFGFEEARLRGLPLLVVNAQAAPGGAAAGPGEEVLAQLRATYPDVAAHRKIIAGDPVSTLVTLAQDAELLVVGARVGQGVPGLTYRSVSHAVLLHASGAVAIVPDVAPWSLP